MNIWEWYYHYNLESNNSNNTKREHKYAIMGTFKIGFYLFFRLGKKLYRQEDTPPLCVSLGGGVCQYFVS